MPIELIDVSRRRPPRPPRNYVPWILAAAGWLAFLLAMFS